MTGTGDIPIVEDTQPVTPKDLTAPQHAKAVDALAEEDRAAAIELTEDGGLVKRILKEGTGELPPPWAEAFVHYRGTLSDGTQFDACPPEGGRTFDFRLGQGRVIKAWDIGVQTMRKGEVAVITATSEYAYGAQGSPPVIPAFATLHFEIEMVDFDPEKPFQEMDASERLENGERHRAEGNDLFRAGDYEGAIKCYKKPNDWFGNMPGATPEQQEQGSELKLKLFMNISQCYMKLQDYTEALDYAQVAAEQNPQNPKGWFRVAMAHRFLGSYDMANEALRDAEKLAPGDAGVKRERIALNNAIKEYKQKESSLASRMMSALGQ